MATQIEVADPDRLYERFGTAASARWSARTTVTALGDRLAAAAADVLAGADRVLCVVILRGGALLYPSFAQRLPAADFLMLGLQRGPDRVRCTYRSAVPRSQYDQVVYLDCVAATGDTVLTARTAIADCCLAERELAAVICSSRPATARLELAGIDLLGFSLDEAVDAGIVSPDLGELDAGDLFSSALAPENAQHP
jgi:uracil phosphoribosyltransferase